MGKPYLSAIRFPLSLPILESNTYERKNSQHKLLLSHTAHICSIFVYVRVCSHVFNPNTNTLTHTHTYAHGIHLAIYCNIVLAPVRVLSYVHRPFVHSECRHQPVPSSRAKVSVVSHPLIRPHAHDIGPIKHQPALHTHTHMRDMLMGAKRHSLNQKLGMGVSNKHRHSTHTHTHVDDNGDKRISNDSTILWR